MPSVASCCEKTIGPVVASPAPRSGPRVPTLDPRDTAVDDTVRRKEQGSSLRRRLVHDGERIAGKTVLPEIRMVNLDIRARYPDRPERREAA